MKSTFIVILVILLSLAYARSSQWRSERVISAEHYVRPKQGNMRYAPFNHHGIKMGTDKGNDYLIHNMPKTGPVVTDAKHMSADWRKRKDIKVTGHKTVGEVLGSAGTSYIGGGTCIGTACAVKNHLKKEPKKKHH